MGRILDVGRLQKRWPPADPISRFYQFMGYQSMWFDYIRKTGIRHQKERPWAGTSDNFTDCPNGIWASSASPLPGDF
jgi:hypothetical protein